MAHVIDNAYVQIRQGNSSLANTWRHEVVFSWRWWLVLALTVLPWVGVFLFLPRRKRNQYLISSFIAMLMSSLFDMAGLTADLWRYYVNLVPILGGFLPWNLSVIPGLLIAFYELWPRVSQLVKGLVFSVFCAFVGEPLTELLGLTNHHRWKHVYSVPLYLGIYLASFYGGQLLSKRQGART